MSRRRETVEPRKSALSWLSRTRQISSHRFFFSGLYTALGFTFFSAPASKSNGRTETSRRSLPSGNNTRGGGIEDRHSSHVNGSVETVNLSSIIRHHPAQTRTFLHQSTPHSFVATKHAPNAPRSFRLHRLTYDSTHKPAGS